MALSPSVVVLFGGVSNERKVSVASAQNVCGALPDAKAWFIDPQGAVFETARARLLAHARAFEQELIPEGTRWGASLAEALDAYPDKHAVFFLALHGGDGENGTTQKVLEERGRAFTGSGSVASRNAFDKVIAKRMVEAKGLKVAKARVVEPGENVLEAIRAFLKVEPRFIAKPVADGSSVGVHRVDATAPHEQIAKEIAATHTAYLFESFLSGRELTVGVVDEPGGLVALPVSEVVMEGDASFDYDAKYLGKGSKEITPADLPPELTREVQRCALTAHEALSCAGYTRSDFISTPNGVYFLETNTLPGLTRASFIPQQLAADGRDLKAFFDRQLSLAAVRG
jgi:D-alanine-D-alanine ligase